MDKPGLKLNHEPMNRLHRYFEDLQGETWNISPYYKLADYETKWAIRQLNDLCHELESWVLSIGKKPTAPEWQRPSQITTFLNAPRQDLRDEDYELFLKNRYDRELVVCIYTGHRWARHSLKCSVMSMDRHRRSHLFCNQQSQILFW
jgi:hypothetical protein